MEEIGDERHVVAAAGIDLERIARQQAVTIVHAGGARILFGHCQHALPVNRNDLGLRRNHLG